MTKTIQEKTNIQFLIDSDIERPSRYSVRHTCDERVSRQVIRHF
jgi:hypothetical protein